MYICQQVYLMFSGGGGCLTVLYYLLKSTATSLASISRKEISSYSSSPLLTSLLIFLPRLTCLVVFKILYPNSSWLPPCHLEFEGGYQCIAQTSLAHWAQPNILYLQFTLFTYTAHIPSLYKALYCTLLFTHQYTDYSVFLSHFILLTWYQSHSSDFLVPVDISGVLPLPSPSSSRHCQKRATAVTPTVPATLRYQRSAHSTAK